MIGVVDYEGGNITSVCHALESVGARFFVARQEEKLLTARKIIMPGVGEAQSAMQSLRASDLTGWLRRIDIPFLGICLGMQLLFDHSGERETECLGIIPGTIRRFESDNPPDTEGRKRKIPHMGWNSVDFRREDRLFNNIAGGSYFYFVHSYYAPIADATIATTEYGCGFSSAVRKDNYYGVQFHPEKSGKPGLQLLHNFISLC